MYQLIYRTTCKQKTAVVSYCPIMMVVASAVLLDMRVPTESPSAVKSELIHWEESSMNVQSAITNWSTAHSKQLCHTDIQIHFLHIVWETLQTTVMTSLRNVISSTVLTSITIRKTQFMNTGHTIATAITVIGNVSWKHSNLAALH